MSTFNWSPAPGATQTINPRVRTASFGDGYVQTVRDGINNMPRSWSVQFTRATSDIDAIEAFLISVGADVPFNWTPPKGAAGKWLCKSWTQSVPASTVQSISATFDEYFGS